MISLEQYKRILDSGLLLDHFLVLCSLRDGQPLPKTRRVDGFINLLNKKGYIDDGALTEKAYEVIDNHPVMIVSGTEVETPRFDFGGWVTQLHEKCKEKLIDLTGKAQVTSKINKLDKKGYPFLPNLADFTAKLVTAISKYKLKDMDAIEAAIICHIEKCSQSNNWFPLMKYYIHKQGEGSQMVTDIENGVEAVVAAKNTQKFV